MMKKLTLKEIINLNPRTKAILKKYRIDYDFGAMDTLEEATMIIGLNADVVDQEIALLAS